MASLMNLITPVTKTISAERNILLGMKTKIAINGFGRIGRILLRMLWNNPHVEVVAINSPGSAEMSAHLLTYDSVYGIWNKNISAGPDFISIEAMKVPYFSAKGKEDLPWKDVRPDVVVDTSGKYKTNADARLHLSAGAKWVVVGCPMTDPDITIVNGVNDGLLNVSQHKIISLASCTSTCAGLVMKVITDHARIVHGFLSTVHAFTNDQNLHDATHKDFRRSRAATQSIIPTSTGVTETLGKLFPGLSGKFSGMSLRVPVVVSSVLSCTIELAENASAAEINEWFVRASEGGLKGKLGTTNLPLVSSDFKQDSHGAVIDLLSTTVVDNHLLNVLAWYDNEWGYTSQVVGFLEDMVTSLA